jgi:hypothetical protein
MVFNKRALILYLFAIIISFNCVGQSVIELIDPFDADVILLSVNNKEEADIIVYKTKKQSECRQWDCMWLFKQWGFSNLSLFIYTDINDTTKYADGDSKYKINGKVYFTQNIEERGYTNPNTIIEGLIKKSREKDSLNQLANFQNDSIPMFNNDSVQAVILKIDSAQFKVIDPVVTIESGNIVFKVQVGACHRQIPDKELHKRYPGNKEISVEMHDGWYKYMIGNFRKYSEAKNEKIFSGTPDAWVVVFRNDKRISITEVINVLSYYTNSRVLILMLS